MFNRRTLLGIFLAALLAAGIGGTGPAIAGSIETGAKSFINSLSDRAIKSLTKQGVPRPERIKRFRELFNDNFAVRTIGKWILGRYWRKASKDQRKEYLNLFEDLIVVSYVDRFAQYTGDGLNIKKTQSHNAKVATVFSEIQEPNATKAVRVDWRVGQRKAGFKILDVVVEGTSMSQTMRSDFGSIIRQKGGKVSGLLEELRKKTAITNQI